MNNFFSYLIEANLALVVMLGIYWLLFRNESSFAIQRMVLLACVLSSTLFPLIRVEIGAGANLGGSNVLREIYVMPELPATAQQGVDVTQWLWAIYITGLAIFAIRLIFQLAAVVKLMRSGKVYRLRDLRIAESETIPATFSFFKFILIGKCGDLTSKEKQHILAHEEVHVKRWHSLDILLVNLIQILFWFNPAVVIYKKIFTQLHEFEADARAARISDEGTYCSLMAKVALQSAGYSLANHFNNSLTIKRIKMVRSIKNSTHTWKWILVTAMFPLMFFILSCQDEADNTVYEVVDEIPQFKGGYEALGSFIGKNLRYPSSARQQGIEGTVYVSFIVEKDGSVSNVETKKGIFEDADKEAVRVISASPDWIPGRNDGKTVRTQFVIPIKFSLQ